eukprot:COSAG01_NODE_6039_length_3884_cov_2.766975_2_plen_80_part_00
MELDRTFPGARHLPCLLLLRAAGSRRVVHLRYGAPYRERRRPRDSQELLRGCLAHGWRGLRERRGAATAATTSDSRVAM